MVKAGPQQIETAMEAAKAVLATRYPDAAFAIVAGSIIRGQGTTMSDIDLVVVFDHLDAAWRESFVSDGFPVEAFVHDQETLNWFIDQDIQYGYPVLITMIAEGRVIGENTDLAVTLQKDAANILNKGPTPLAGPRLDALRYEITDLLDDLRGERSYAELRAIGAKLFQPLADLILLGRGTWSGRGKWAPRLLGRLEGDILEKFDHAFQQLAGGNCGPVVRMTESELALHGGALFAGDRREAPASARRPASSEQK
jgi:hypothetical protein